MKKKELEQRIAHLESINDQLSTEVSYIDHLMKVVGFSRGIETVKATAQEIIRKGYHLDNQNIEDDEENDYLEDFEGIEEELKD